MPKIPYIWTEMHKNYTIYCTVRTYIPLIYVF